MMLHIGLHDGFTNDTVTVRVDGKEVFRRAGVTTNLAIAHSRAVDVPIEEDVARVEVSTDNGVSAARDVRTAETPFVAARIVAGQLQILVSQEPFPML